VELAQWSWGFEICSDFHALEEFLNALFLIAIASSSHTMKIFNMVYTKKHGHGHGTRVRHDTDTLTRQILKKLGHDTVGIRQ